MLCWCVGCFGHIFPTLRYLSLPLLAIVVPAMVMTVWFLYRKRKPVTAEAWVVSNSVPLAATRHHPTSPSQQQQQQHIMSPEALRSHAVNRFKTAVVVCLFLLHNKVSKVRGLSCLLVDCNARSMRFPCAQRGNVRLICSPIFLLRMP